MEEEYKDVYKMLEEMAGLIHQDLKPASDTSEEEKKETDSDDSDDEFGGDRDVGWEGARQRKKSPFRGGQQPK
jgi:hypothetical protein